MQITVLVGGVGGARFLCGLFAHFASSDDLELRVVEVIVVGNIGDDIMLFGLWVCFDFDIVMYIFGGGIDDV